MELAILRLVNGIKVKYFIPKNVQMANITTIYKRSGSRHDLESDRGIFSLSIWRKLIDKIIYLEKQAGAELCQAQGKLWLAGL